MSSPHHSSVSSSLLHRLQAGSSTSWEAVVEVWQPVLVRWCQRRGVPARDVEDVVQEALQATHRGIASMAGTTAAVSYYVYNLLKKPNGQLVQSLNEVRQQQSAVEQSLQELVDSIAADKKGPGLAEEVRQAVRQAVAEGLVQGGWAAPEAESHAEAIAHYVASFPLDTPGPGYEFPEEPPRKSR